MLPPGPKQLSTLVLFVLVALASLNRSGSSAAAPHDQTTTDAGTNRRTPLVEAIAKALPSVVSISSEKRAESRSRWPFSAEENERPRVSGMGTGVILDHRGFIITNQHVVDRVEDLRVYLHNGTSLPARVIEEDPLMDLALIKVESTRPLPAITIGDSNDLMVGETVITIGNAFGYENTTSVGIISALGRNVTLLDNQVYRNLIQTDANINPGNSGGPLINIDGELIGINVATRAGAQGIGFALPIDDVKPIAAEMLSAKRLSGNWHGLVAAERFWKGSRRVIVSAIEAGSPAERAGVRPNDTIIQVNDLVVRNPIDLERGFLEVSNEAATLLVDRDGDRREISLLPERLQRRPGRQEEPDLLTSIWQRLGVRVLALDAHYLTSVSENLRGGLYIEEVAPGGLADQASIRPGDILVGVQIGVNHWETVRPENLVYILDQALASQSQQVPFYIVRNNRIHQGEISLASGRRERGFPTIR